MFSNLWGSVASLATIINERLPCGILPFTSNIQEWRCNFANEEYPTGNIEITNTTARIKPYVIDSCSWLELISMCTTAISLFINILNKSPIHTRLINVYITSYVDGVLSLLLRFDMLRGLQGINQWEGLWVVVMCVIIAAAWRGLTATLNRYCSKPYRFK